MTLDLISDLYDFDIGAMERAAYQSGDVQLATLLARLDDAETGSAEELKAAEENAEELERIGDKAKSDLEDLRVSVRDRIANLEAIFNGAAKCSNRREIGEAIEALYAEVESK